MDRPEAVPDVQSALSQAISRVLAEFYGKGPRRTRSFLFDDYVFAVCDDALTTAEVALRDAGEGELVREVRVGFEDLMTTAFVTGVETVTGRTVVAYHSQVQVAVGSLLEIFVLDPGQPGLAIAPDPVAEVRDVALVGPGRPGDADALPAPGTQSPPREAAGEALARPRAPHGARRAALAQDLRRLASELHGRGPARARVYLADEHVFCTLEDALTTVEQTLAVGGRTDLVRRMRERLLDAHAARYAEVLAAHLDGAQVVSSAAQVLFDPDVVVLSFALDRPAAPDGDGDG